MILEGNTYVVYLVPLEVWSRIPGCFCLLSKPTTNANKRAIIIQCKRIKDILSSAVDSKTFDSFHNR